MRLARIILTVCFLLAGHAAQASSLCDDSTGRPYAGVYAWVPVALTGAIDAGNTRGSADGLLPITPKPKGSGELTGGYRFCGVGPEWFDVSVGLTFTAYKAHTRFNNHPDLKDGYIATYALTPEVIGHVRLLAERGLHLDLTAGAGVAYHDVHALAGPAAGHTFAPVGTIGIGLSLPLWDNVLGAVGYKVLISNFESKNENDPGTSSFALQEHGVLVGFTILF